MRAEPREGKVRLGPDATGKFRAFGTGLLLAVITLGLYEIWWYYYLNDELRSIGRLLGDSRLARTLPGLSVTALAFGLASTGPTHAWWPFEAAALVAFVASLISQHRFGRRIRRAEELLGIPEDRRFGRWSVLLVFPGALLLIPYIFWFARVTRHQNALLDLAEDLPRVGAAIAA
jgi:hypothetical protein